MVLQKECMATGRTRLYIDVTLRFLICNGISVNIPMRYKNNNTRYEKYVALSLLLMRYKHALGEQSYVIR